MDDIQIYFMMSSGSAVQEGDGYRCSGHVLGQVRSNDIAQIEINGAVVSTGTHMMLHANDGDFVRVVKVEPPPLDLTEADIAKARSTVTVTVASQERYDEGPFSFGASYTDGSLSEVIDSLIAIRDSIPAEYRSAARCEIDSESGYEGSHYASIEVTYERPETDEEVTRRLHQESVKAKIDRAAEYAAYERLAKKFNR